MKRIITRYIPILLIGLLIFIGLVDFGLIPYDSVVADTREEIDGIRVCVFQNGDVWELGYFIGLCFKKENELIWRCCYLDHESPRWWHSNIVCGKDNKLLILKDEKVFAEFHIESGNVVLSDGSVAVPIELAPDLKQARFLRPIFAQPPVTVRRDTP